MYLSKVEQMSYRWNKYSNRLVPWNKYYSIIFSFEQILLGTNIRLHILHYVIRRNNQKKKDKRTNNYIYNTTKDRAARTPLKSEK